MELSRGAGIGRRHGSSAEHRSLDGETRAGGVPQGTGEYWTVGWRDRPFRLKDSKGFTYLAHLLRHPTVEFHALDLVGGLARHRDDDDAGGLDPDLDAAGLHVASTDDAGELLDDRAKAAYRRRLEELRAELDAAKAGGRVEVAEAAEREIASLTAELARAIGLHGRRRARGVCGRARAAERHEDGPGRRRAD